MAVASDVIERITAGQDVNVHLSGSLDSEFGIIKCCWTNSKTIQRKPSVIDCQSGGYRRPVPLRDDHRIVGGFI